MKQKKPIKVFYTDGSCQHNPGPGGWGVVRLCEKDIVYVMNESCKDTTNNREELKAIIHVLKLAAADPSSEYLVYSDSAYAVHMINNWIWGWAKNSWLNSKKKEVENIDLVKEIYSYISKDFFNFQIKKCNGHAGVLENELADSLATVNPVKFNNLVKSNNLNVLCGNNFTL